MRPLSSPMPTILKMRSCRPRATASLVPMISMASASTRSHRPVHDARRVSAADIHAIGIAEVERIKAEMLSCRSDAGFPATSAGFRRRLQTDNQQFAASARRCASRSRYLSKRIDARIPEFFGRTPRTTYGVGTIPEAIAEKMPPAYAQPNPGRRQRGWCPLDHLLPSKCPRYIDLPLALHEAWPGHLMHLALIQEMDELPDFRRFGALKYTACLEGWALYCEALGEDMGFYDTPEKRYGRLEMEMWRAVRLVLDTGIHARGWNRDRGDCLLPGEHGHATRDADGRSRPLYRPAGPGARLSAR